MQLRDGSEVEAAVDVNSASRDLAGQAERLDRKFSRLAEPVVGRGAADDLRALLGSLDGGVGVRELMALTRLPCDPAALSSAP
jgi:hypothetical protein